MVFVVIGLTVLVLMLARDAPPDPAAGSTTSPGPDLSINSLGSSGVPSPAKANGNPFIAQQNGVRLNSSYFMAQPYQKVLAAQSPQRFYLRRQSFMGPGNYPTDAQSSLMTQDVPALVANATNVSNNLGKL